MIWLCVAAAVLLILFLLYLFLIAPSGRKRKTEAFFAGQNRFAHRGLYGGDVPENSLLAFERACTAGYGIELDVHVTADGKLVVFHDDTTERMCGVPGTVEEKTLAELQALCLNGTGEHIPSFDEVLSLVRGRAVLIIELKGRQTDTAVCTLTASALEGYAGAWCVESFNPFYLRWWRKNRRDVIRGILSCRMPPDDFLHSRFKNFLLENMLFSFLSRPDFLAYGIDSRTQPSFLLARAMGGYAVGWTADSERKLETAYHSFGAVIFEHCLP